jgi:hypothetical protein
VIAAAHERRLRLRQAQNQHQQQHHRHQLNNLPESGPRAGLPQARVDEELKATEPELENSKSNSIQNNVDAEDEWN